MFVMIFVIVVGFQAVYVYTSLKEKQRLNEKIAYQSSLIRDLTEDVVCLDERPQGGFRHVS
ncbi:hypothetical protein DUK53_17105 [Listeria sp. SHR_NRA_18]|uniref:hypothetical protein n=1 Tax=Listeria sp. SHR_NRA_18 TaxID=2269046 RepID=UPI000F6006A6|nr:hypothetical protein [Listeria sp. SHR_NRA_18]RQW65306.1 hypothetical protein DUK53_17105 [Listeria sp. SHR_NRA_18]